MVVTTSVEVGVEEEEEASRKASGRREGFTDSLRFLQSPNSVPRRYSDSSNGFGSGLYVHGSVIFLSRVPDLARGNCMGVRDGPRISSEPE